jgi:CRISPR-associated protein Cas2
MSQFSVYLKFCAGKEQAEALARQVETEMPPFGKVHLVSITDKQYENIRTYCGRKRECSPKMPNQLALF